MQRFRVYYCIKETRCNVVVSAPTSTEACDYVREEYGPCRVLGVECL